MPQHEISPIQQLNSKRWLQLAMTFDDPAPIVQLAAPASTAARGRLLAQRCPMCGAALVHVDIGEQCTRCGAVVDL